MKLNPTLNLEVLYVPTNAILQLDVTMVVSDLRMHGKKIGKVGRHLIIKPGKRALRVIWLIINHQSIALILDDHVAHDNKNSHHFPHLLFRPRASRLPDNSKTSSEHTKSPAPHPSLHSCVL